jgi:hypothetical protein
MVQCLFASPAGFNSLVGGVMGFSILLSAEVFKHDAAVWYLDGSIGVLIGLTIFAYGVKYVPAFIIAPLSTPFPSQEVTEQDPRSHILYLCPS